MDRDTTAEMNSVPEDGTDPAGSAQVQNAAGESCDGAEAVKTGDTRIRPDFTVREEAQVLKRVVKTLFSIADEAMVCFDGEGRIVIPCIDPAHVAMIECTFTPDSLSLNGWEAAEGKRLTEPAYAIDLERLDGFLSLLGVKDGVAFGYDSGRGKFVVSSGNLEKTFEPADASDMSAPRMPHIELPSSVSIAGDRLYRAVRAMEKISDHVRLRITPEEFTVMAGNDTEVQKATFTSPDVDIRWNGEADSLIPADYLSHTFATFGRDPVTVEVGKNYPLRTTLNIGYYGMLFMVAPRVEG
ncbi:MAG: hypothetical protein KIS29_05155 [Thermoplasmata archaeon]|nr:hypothetical protein [Candidatus Sysuiplasma jiujiangense]